MSLPSIYTQDEDEFVKEMITSCQYMTLILHRMSKIRQDIHPNDVVTWLIGITEEETYLPNITMVISRLDEDCTVQKSNYHTIMVAKDWVRDALYAILQEIDQKIKEKDEVHV